MKRLLCLSFLLLPASLALADKDPARVLEPGKQPQDRRLGKPKTLNDFFPMTVPASKDAWETRRRELREQVLVANGLWPMLPRTPLNPVVHGKIDRDEYTVEKVFFASLPGHYVTGNLYRPKGKSGKLPAVLCPHGHWTNGRLYDAGEKGAETQITQGAEKTVESARYPLQARCVQLARMGCVVFFYDMIGYADSLQIPHRQGFTDADAELRLQSQMGLQTWNSIRALDFLLSLPEVDVSRVGVTGASGGGTQTFILGAIDDRPTAAFPAVMVSTAMQGGCVCENSSYLRQDCGNIDLAAAFAPRPLGMTGAKDWTIDIETKGLPELKAVYRLYGVEDKVMAKCFPQFGHNYNQVSREVMYNWFNKHLQLGHPEPVVEKPFTPVPPNALSVYDASHPLPKDAAKAEDVRRTLTAISDKQMEAIQPKDATSLKQFREIVGTALRVMVNDRLPKPDEVEVKEVGDRQEKPDLIWRRYLIGRKGAGEQIPAIGIMANHFNGQVVVWIHPEGKASLYKGNDLVPAARQLVTKGYGILAPDVFLTGEFGQAKPMPINAQYAGYTFGYNRPLVANRVRDILTVVAMARLHPRTKAVHLVGFEKAGPWVVLARALCGEAIGRTAADLDQFRFDKVRTTSDEMMLPGVLKYGGLPAFAALCAPGELLLHNHRGTGVGATVKSAYEAAGMPKRQEQVAEKLSAEKVVEWLVR